MRMLVVEEAFRARGRGVLLAPRFTAAEHPRGTFRVELRLPSGEQREAVAEIDVAHMRGPLPPYAMIRLPELAPEDVPAGTEVWTIA
jgi:hypothetical protein